MQIPHLNSLLKNYKMGVRIRFEYHFNNWRTKIGIPLKSEEILQHSNNSCCCHYNKNIGNGPSCEPNSTNNKNSLNISNISSAKRKRQNADDIEQTVEVEDTQTPLSPNSVKSETLIIPKVSPLETVNLPSASDSQAQQTNDNEEQENETDNLAVNTLNELISSIHNDKPPKFPSKPTPDRSPVNLLQILQLSGARALSIVKFYKDKKHLTNIHRSQLIQIIVEFFDQNDYHLSLNASHNLEWEILKMFPTEKLEYYRTEKRGKIYVKYSNMKRYKRERNIKVNNELEMLNTRQRRSNQQNDENKRQTDDGVDVDTENYDEWPLMPEPEIEVKEEYLSD